MSTLKKDEPLFPPFDLNAKDYSRVRTQAEQQAIFSAYERMVAYAATNLTVMISQENVNLAEGK